MISAAVNGIESKCVLVEADVSDGLPMFSMVGYLASEVREAQDRVRTALRNSGYALPPKHITVNSWLRVISESPERGSTFRLRRQ